MDETNKKLEKSIKYWHDSALKDLEAAENLFQKKFYPQSLFFCHLSIEKFLKSLVMRKTRETAPYIHDLIRLAQIADIILDKKKKKTLEEILIFNIAGRYQEEKLEFHKKYNNRDIVEKYFKITKDLILWLEKEYQKK